MDNLQQLPFDCIKITQAISIPLMKGQSVIIGDLKYEGDMQISALKGQNITINDQFGIALCTRGHFEILIDKQQYDINVGDMFFYSPMTLLHILNVSDEIEAVVFISGFDFIIPIIKKTFYIKNLLMPKIPCITLTHSEYVNINQLINHLYRTLQEYTSKTIYNRKYILHEIMRLLAQAICYEAINIYLREIPYDSQSKINDRKNTILQNFIFSLCHNYNKERNVAFYANQQYITSRYFSTIIKKESGKTALEWIIQMVIVNAKQMLEYSNLSIKEIAMKLNFPTQSFFGKYFKNYAGISPKEYRRNIRIIPAS